MQHNFIPTTPNEILTNMVNIYEKSYFEQTGVRVQLKPADEERILLNCMGFMIYHGYERIDYYMMQNLVDYAEGEYLDGLTAMLDVTRLPQQCAKTMVRFTLSAIQNEGVVIPKGTRVSNGGQLLFNTIEAAIILPGEQWIDITVTALEAGKESNGLLSGQINTLVDPIPYIVSVSNIDTTQGGADVEDDENLRYRFKLKPGSMSTAGPEDAYKYYVYSYSQTIIDCEVSQSSPGNVEIKILLENGEMPTQSIIDDLKLYLRNYRPLTDNINISGPTVHRYDMEFTYYICSTRLSESETIKSNIALVAERFNHEQGNKIGKNIVPDELTKMCLEAGASRLSIVSPVFIPVNKTTVGKVNVVSIVFGGVDGD